MSPPPPGVTVLGPQRRPTLGQFVWPDAGGSPGDHTDDRPIAVVTAGWLEREADDGEVRSLLGNRGVNLGLHARWLDVRERDREFAGAAQEHRAVLDELQQNYLVALDHALTALHATAARGGGRPRTAVAAMEDALAVVRLVDERHAMRVRRAHDDFAAAWLPQDRPVIAEHRADVQRRLEDAAGLVVAGGHVGVLLRVLHLFHVAPFVPPTVVSWSAGAMALTERVVLFHDRAPQGPSHAELYDAGIGLLHGVVLLPHARRRLRVDDLPHMAVLAARFAPDRCVVLDDGIRIDIGRDGALPPDARVVGDQGRILAVGTQS